MEIEGGEEGGRLCVRERKTASAMGERPVSERGWRVSTRSERGTGGGVVLGVWAWWTYRYCLGRRIGRRSCGDTPVRWLP